MFRALKTWLGRLLLLAALSGLSLPRPAAAMIAPPSSDSFAGAALETQAAAISAAADPAAETEDILLEDADGNLWLAAYVGQNPHNGASVYVLSPLGLTGEGGNAISLNIPGVQDAYYSGSADWLHPNQLNGNMLVDSAEATAAATTLVVPRPDLTYKLGRNQADIAFDSNTAGSYRSFGAMGMMACAVLTVSDCIPVVCAGENLIVRAITKAEVRAAEQVSEKVAVSAAKTPLLLPAAKEPLLLTAGKEDAFVASFMGNDHIVYYDKAGATLGAKGKTVWVAPVEDVAGISTRAGVVTGTGHAPGPLQSYLNGEPIYGIAVPQKSVALRLPRATEPGVNQHYRFGGLVGVEHNGTWKSSNVHEWVLDGGAPVPNGSVLFRFNPDGSWTIIRRY